MVESENLNAADNAIIRMSREELQIIAKEQFGRPLSETEIQALVDLSPIGLHDWISLAIEAARLEPGYE